MKINICLQLITTFSPFLLCSQVIDSTFGEPDSFTYPSPYEVFGVTGCDFESRNDRAFTMFHLGEDGIILRGSSSNADSCDFAFVRLTSSGKFDTSIGTKGRVRIDLGYQNDSCLAAARLGKDHLIMAGCASPTSSEKYVGLLTKVDSTFGLNLYPNPISGEPILLTIEGIKPEDFQKNLPAALLDVHGRRVLSTEISGGEKAVLSFDGVLPSGVYWLLIRGKGREYRGKVVVVGD